MVDLDDPEQLAGYVLSGARVAAGVLFFWNPLGRLLIGRDAERPGAQLFIRLFGGRNVVLGLGLLQASHRRRDTRPWVLVCGLADVSDVAVIVAGYRRLPPRRRALTFTAAVIPALLNLGTASRLPSRA